MFSGSAVSEDEAEDYQCSPDKTGHFIPSTTTGCNGNYYFCFEGFAYEMV